MLRRSLNPLEFIFHTVFYKKRTKEELYVDNRELGTHGVEMTKWATITEIEYQYRDASNYKFLGSFLVKGKITWPDVKNYLFDDEFFIPYRLGLPGLQPQQRNKDDHELHSFEDFKTYSGKEYDVSRSKLLRKLAFANENGWFY